MALSLHLPPSLIPHISLVLQFLFFPFLQPFHLSFPPTYLQHLTVMFSINKFLFVIFPIFLIVVCVPVLRLNNIPFLHFFFSPFHPSLRPSLPFLHASTPLLFPSLNSLTHSLLSSLKLPSIPPSFTPYFPPSLPLHPSNTHALPPSLTPSLPPWLIPSIHPSLHPHSNLSEVTFYIRYSNNLSGSFRLLLLHINIAWTY